MARQRPEDARTGWKSRRAAGRNSRRRLSPEERAAANAARASLIASIQQERDFNPEVRTRAASGEDFVAQLSDADLVALYKQLHAGRAPAPKAKRPAIERAVRKAQAERAAEQPDTPDDADQVEDDV